MKSGRSRRNLGRRRPALSRSSVVRFDPRGSPVSFRISVTFRRVYSRLTSTCLRRSSAMHLAARPPRASLAADTRALSAHSCIASMGAMATPRLTPSRPSPSVAAPSVPGTHAPSSATRFWARFCSSLRRRHALRSPAALLAPTESMMASSSARGAGKAPSAGLAPATSLRPLLPKPA